MSFFVDCKSVITVVSSGCSGYHRAKKNDK